MKATENFALAGRFFMFTATAHIEVATLHAAKLTEDHKDSVNIWHMLNLVENEKPKARTQRAIFKQAVEFGRQALAEAEVDIAKVKEHRDRHLAHVDRSRFNSGLNQQSAVEAAVLWRIFGRIGEILIRLRALFVEAQEDSAGEAIISEAMGARGLGDLFFFARLSVLDPQIPSPSVHAEKVRSLERALREVQRDFEEAQEHGKI